jgi:hypothetical protein
MLRADFLLANPQDMTIPICVEDGAGIVRVIRDHHAAWKLAQGMQAGQG